MKKAVIFRFLGIVLLAVGVSSLIFYYFIGRYILEDTISSMEMTISVVDYSLDYEGNLQEQLEELGREVMEETARITLIGLDGKVEADNSGVDPETMENHLEREEVAQTIEKGSGSARRYSESQEKKFLYVAKLTQNGEYVLRMAVPYTGMFDYLGDVFPVLLGGVGLTFLISGFAAVRFSNTITHPLLEISEELGKVKSEGLHFDFKHYQYPELNVIADTTRGMAEEIRAHMQRLEKEKRIRQEFFSNASHELKTPITSIRGYAELLEQDLIPDEGVRKDFLHRILKETEHMTSVINDILMISRLEAKEAEVTFSMVKIPALVKELFESMEPMAAEYKVKLHQDCEDVELYASVQQMRELLSNLISNGIKYNHPEGNVWVEAEKDGEYVRIYVRDDGCGISKEEQARIFERFYRVDKGRSRKMGGTGLGLSIVKHIVEYYNGEITLRSCPGKGSEFIVLWPVKI